MDKAGRVRGFELCTVRVLHRFLDWRVVGDDALFLHKDLSPIIRFQFSIERVPSSA